MLGGTSFRKMIWPARVYSYLDITKTGTTKLGALLSYARSRRHYIDDAGTIYDSHVLAGDNLDKRAFMWSSEKEGSQLIPLPEGGIASCVGGVTPRGYVAGQYATATDTSGLTHMYYYDPVKKETKDIPAPFATTDFRLQYVGRDGKIYGYLQKYWYRTYGFCFDPERDEMTLIDGPYVGVDEYHYTMHSHVKASNSFGAMAGFFYPSGTYTNSGAFLNVSGVMKDITIEGMGSLGPGTMRVDDYGRVAYNYNDNYGATGSRHRIAYYDHLGHNRPVIDIAPAYTTHMWMYGMTTEGVIYGQGMDEESNAFGFIRLPASGNKEAEWIRIGRLGINDNVVILSANSKGEAVGAWTDPVTGQPWPLLYSYGKTYLLHADDESWIDRGWTPYAITDDGRVSGWLGNYQTFVMYIPPPDVLTGPTVRYKDSPSVVYVIVKRNMNGREIRCIERMQFRPLGEQS